MPGMANSPFIAALFSVLLGILIACGGEAGTPTSLPEIVATPTTVPTPVPTEIVLPTTVPEATPTTAAPTPTPEATATPLSPTELPEATLEPVPPTQTPEPTPVATQGDLFLQLVNPPEVEVFVSESPINVVGRTRVDAVVSVNDTLVEPDIDGEFSLIVDLEEGPNIIEIVASVASGEQKDLVLVVVYLQ